MKISDYSIQKLGEFLAGDILGWPYRRGADLVDFFNKYGFREVYGEGFPTRRFYAQEKLKKLNGQSKLRDVIREMLDPRLWSDSLHGNVEDAARKVNDLLKYDGYEVVKDGMFYRVRELSGAIVEVETIFDAATELSELLIEEQIRKCKEKIELGDYSGAITNARSLVEAVCMKIESELSTEAIDNDGDQVRSFNRVRKLLNLDPGRKDIADSLKQVLSGMTSIVAGLASMRNKMSDAHAGNYKPSRHHAKLAVNSAKTLADFLFETKAYQEEKGTLKAKATS